MLKPQAAVSTLACPALTQEHISIISNCSDACVNEHCIIRIGAESIEKHHRIADCKIQKCFCFGLLDIKDSFLECLIRENIAVRMFL